MKEHVAVDRLQPSSLKASRTPQNQLRGVRRRASCAPLTLSRHRRGRFSRSGPPSVRFRARSEHGGVSINHMFHAAFHVALFHLGL